MTRARRARIARTTTSNAFIDRYSPRSEYSYSLCGSERSLTFFDYRLEKVIETMMLWMSSQSERLIALSKKLDSFDETLRRHEGRSRRIQGTPTSSNAHFATPEETSFQDSPSSSAGQFNSSSALHWPAVRSIISESRVTFDDAYLVAAEDRPVLRLRRGSYREDDMVSERESSQHIEDEDPFDHRPRKRKRTHSDASEFPINLDGIRIQAVFDAFVRHCLGFLAFLELEPLHHSINGFLQTYANFKAIQGIHPAKRRCLDGSSRPTGLKDFERTPLNGIVLLVLAIGEASTGPCCMSAGKDTTTSTRKIEQSTDEGIAGIAYFRQAVKILAAHMDGNELDHAHMFLLAGFYKAQLARMNEASSWYSMAGRVLLHLVRRRRLLGTEGRPTETIPHVYQYSTDDHMTLTTAWSCIKLELDITPDLRLPSSGLCDVVHRLPLPERVETLDYSRTTKIGVQWQGIMSFQHLVQGAHTRLSKICQNFRNEQLAFNTEQRPESTLESLNAFEVQLKGWRASLPPQLRWNDDHTPSGSVSLAHMRHSFWEARLQSLQPYLEYVLHARLPREASCEPINGRATLQFAPDNSVCEAVDDFFKKLERSEIILNAMLAVDAAKQSIAAFNGVRKRLVLPDLLSVMHERFANVLLLAAAHRCEHLNGTVSSEDLCQMMDSTLKDLEGFSRISPAGEADRSILQAVHRSFVHGWQ